MKKGVLTLCVAAIATGASGSVYADSLTVSGSTGGGWRTFVAPNESGAQFWDVPSLDGSQMNVGYFLTGTGGFVGNANSPGLSAANLSYWGLSTGKADLTETLNTVLGVSANLKVQVAGLAGQSSVGYYTGNSISTYTTIFGPSATAGASTTFTPNGTFGLAIKPTNDSTTYASQASLSTAYNGNQDVAIFRYITGGTTTYYIGFEDSPGGTYETVGSGNNVGDFNDMVIKLTVQPVPEASTVAAIGALGAGVGLQGFRVYRKRQAAK